MVVSAEAAGAGLLGLDCWGCWGCWGCCGCLDVVLPDAADMLSVDVPRPLDHVRDDESLHQPVVDGVDVECSDGASVERVH